MYINRDLTDDYDPEENNLPEELWITVDRLKDIDADSNTSTSHHKE
jgi:hypothetical protein